MRTSPPDRLEKGRVRGRGSAPGDMHGYFLVPAPGGVFLWVIGAPADASDWAAAGLPGIPFEHVSVSVRKGGRPAERCPTWDEMCFVKDLFWDPEEAVVQYHPPRSAYVNYHPYCLHLWKPVGVAIPLPPAACVGPAAVV